MGMHRDTSASTNTDGSLTQPLDFRTSQWHLNRIQTIEAKLECSSVPGLVTRNPVLPSEAWKQQPVILMTSGNNPGFIANYISWVD